MNRKDMRVVRALAPNFDRFRELAARVKADPSTRSVAEAEMAAMLDTMSPAERLELRKALVAASPAARDVYAGGKR